MKVLPKIFIASSSVAKAKDAAESLSNQLNPIASVDCWFDPSIFRNGEFTLGELLRVAKSYDMGIFIFNDDDSIEINGKKMVATRDNVILEYGMFVSSLAPKYCFIIIDSNITNFRLPTDILGLTYLEYDSKRDDMKHALRPCIDHIQKSIKEWENGKPLKNKFFDNFYINEEPELQDGFAIEYNRSFNLLLYMFANESFKEFRALDLAFSRWEEAFTDRDRISSQITNYSKDIIATTKSLFRTGRCTNFRRILVITTIGGVTKKTIEVLNLIRDTEKEALRFNSKGIIETRILRVNQWDHKVDFNTYNDFALFTGEADEFAIVETTLNSPYSNAAPGHCIIVENPERLRRRKVFFDDIWANETISITEFIATYDKADVSETIAKASDLLHQNSVSGQTGIIIETAYVELIKLGDKRRNVPFERAFELLNEVSVTSKFKGHIFLDAFINDFRPKFSVFFECSESCEIEDISDDANFKQLKADITKRLKAVNSSFNINDDMITTFYMTKTRNNAVKYIKRVMTHSPEKIQFKDRGDGTRDIYLRSKDINLGYEKENGVVPNCALLMAEHYYELFRFVIDKHPSFTSVWIFDFLIYNEKNYVEQGLQTALELYDWPAGVSLNIVNCTYEIDGTGDIRHFGPYNF